MAVKQRAVDRGAERGRNQIRAAAREIREARRGRGLSMRAVGRAVRRSESWVSRLERGLIPNVGVDLLARVSAVIGLDLSLRLYPGGQPLRDARHAALLRRLRAHLHPDLGWRLEVPLPDPRDQRAWDATIKGRAAAWRFGVEAETYPTDGQALARRLALKSRDGAVDGVILLLPDTRQTRAFRREFAGLLATDFPIAGAEALRR